MDGSSGAAMASSAAEVTKKVADMSVAAAAADEGSKSKKKKSFGGGGGKQQQQQQKEPPREWTDEMQADYERILSVGEECISAQELKGLITAKGRGSDHRGFNLYDGFEPSGRMHIAQGVFKVRVPRTVTCTSRQLSTGCTWLRY